MADRALLGQVFTPEPVVRLTLALALDGAPDGPLLDPSCGDGAFLDGMTRVAGGARRVIGVELDARHAATARRRVPGAEIREGDFFEGAAPAAAVIAGNPPWVRQERLGPARKEIVLARLAADWPEVRRWQPLVGRGDLALAFVARALAGLAPGGRLAFVLSQAVLDADYGRALFAFLEGRARVLGLVTSPRERWFAEADVHAAILVLERSGSPAGPEAAPPPLSARLRVPVSDAAARVTGWADLSAVAEVRTGLSLRAPAVWDAAQAGLVPLGDLADVRRGLTAGANHFYYMTPARAAELGLARWARPLLKTPSDARAIRVTASALPQVAVLLEPPLDAAGQAHVSAHASLATRPSFAPRDPWWRLPARPARLFLTKAYDARFVQPLADEAIVADQRMYAVEPRAGVDVELLAAVLNSSLGALAVECTGRASMGQGALELSVGDAARLPVMDPRRLAEPERVRAAFRQLAGRPAGTVLEPHDRVLDDALGIPASLRGALADTVADRLARSRSRPRSHSR